MRPELERIERIEQYILGQLEGDALKDFEQELKSNPQLAEEVLMQRILVKGVENAGLKKMLNHIHLHDYDRGAWWRTWRNFILLGSLIVAVITAGFIIAYNEKKEAMREEREAIRVFSDSLDSEAGVNEIEEKVSSILDKDLPVFFEHSNPIDRYFSGYIRPYLFSIDPNKDTIVTGPEGTKISIKSGSFTYENGLPVNGKITLHLKEIYKKSDIILNDLVNTDEEGIESSGSVFLDAYHEKRQVRLAKGKTMEVGFIDKVPHVDNPHSDSVEIVSNPEFHYYKIFEDKEERRLVLLPALVLDYDIIYTRKTADPLMNERVESLLLPEYENTFTSTTQFHYRIEGCQLYGKGVELLDLYLNNTHLPLWQADSLVVEYLNNKAYQDCQNFERYMKAAEYFRWLKSFKHGRVERIRALDYRNYRKGQFYNKLPDKVLEKYLKDNGVTKEESDELIGYFKKMFFFSKMFYKKRKLPKDSREAYLDYYYANEGKLVGFEKNDCIEDSPKPAQKSYVYKTGDNIGTATELNYFLPANRLGWINRERFVNYKNTTSMKVELKGLAANCYSKAYIVFRDENAVLGGRWTKLPDYLFERVPKGSKAYLVALAYDEKFLYYGSKEIIVGEHAAEILELNRTTEAFIRKDLSKVENP